MLEDLKKKLFFTKFEILWKKSSNDFQNEILNTLHNNM